MRPRSKAPQDAASIRRWSSVEGVVSWFWRVLLPQHRATLTRQGMSKLRKHQSMILVDLRGQDRASGAIPAVSWNSSACPILPESQPWISSRKSGNMWRSLGTSRLWHCFCQYSAHRAEPYALNIGRMPRSAGPEISPHISGQSSRLAGHMPCDRLKYGNHS